MERDERALLWDALRSIEAIQRFVASKDAAAYHADEMLRSAVERRFEVVGEALGRLAKVSPQLAAAIADLKDAVAFRNVLIHGYAVVDDDLVWKTITEDLPRLRDEVASLLQTDSPK